VSFGEEMGYKYRVGMGKERGLFWCKGPPQTCKRRPRGGFVERALGD
jgi:hypothetical protein